MAPSNPLLVLKLKEEDLPQVPRQDCCAVLGGVELHIFTELRCYGTFITLRGIIKTKG